MYYGNQGCCIELYKGTRKDMKGIVKRCSILL